VRDPIARRRVVISGMGVVSALGFDEATMWAALSAGRGGIGVIRHPAVEGVRTTVGATIDRVDLTAALAAEGLRYQDFTVDASLLAAGQALRQAGLTDADGRRSTPLEAAVLAGTGIGCTEGYFGAVTSYFEKGLRGVRPTTVPRCMANAICSKITIRYRLTGPSYVVTAACTSATVALGIGFRLIRDGYIDTVVCTGADTIFDPLMMVAWDRLGIMTRNPDPRTACRPFDRDRDGCVIGEGAGALVLEALDTARGRGAAIRAELCGYGESSDASHLTAPDSAGQARAIRAALDCAGIEPDALGTVNAHGTATGANDVAECAAMRAVFGTAAASIPVASHTPYVGHLLGGSGALETVTTVLTLEHGLIPPALNLAQPDPACAGIRFAGPVAEPLQRPYALKNSFGFGGSNGVLVLRRWDD